MAGIPPDFELRRARANNKDEARMRHLGDIGGQFVARFREVSPLDHFELLPQIDVNFRAYIFFKKNRNIAECEANGTSQDMRDFVYDKLEEFGRGKRNETKIVFEFDSFENVQENFEGNYFLRMR